MNNVLKLAITSLSIAAIALLTAGLPGDSSLADSHKANPIKANPIKANPIKERQKLMRSVGKAMKTTQKMLQGQLAYDATAAKEAMTTMSDAATKFPDYFPEGSDMENAIMDFDTESDAKPDIWQNLADFKSKADALKQASSEAATAAGSGKDALGAKIGAVGMSCKECHSKYKADRN